MILWFIVFLCTSCTASSDLSFRALDDPAIRAIQALLRKNPDKIVTVSFTGDPSVKKTFTYFVQNTASFLYTISPQNILLKCTASLLGVTTLSYFFVAYFIYRVYGIIARITSWLSWNQELHTQDMIEEAKHYLERKQRMQQDRKIVRSKHDHDMFIATIQEEENLLRLYIFLNKRLKHYGLRSLFMYDEKKETCIENALVLLQCASELDRKRSEQFL